MSKRPHVAPLLVSAAAVVAAVSWWVGNSALNADAQPVTEPIVMNAKASSAEPVERPPLTPRIAADAPLEGEDDGLGDEDVWAHISDPANSNLPPDLFMELAQLGIDVVRADATGKGRDRWPGYWSRSASSRARTCCSHVVVHAAGAFTDTTHVTSVRVNVIWTGSRGHRNIQRERVSSVVLIRHQGSWWPQR